MDKFEYKVRADEIKTLIAEGDYKEAAIIADTIDWRRVKSVMMLCTVSDVYKINRRYEESKEILLLAYERHPGGRLIVYSLCELSLKLGEFVQAIEYYKEFVQVAPKDNSRYILQYKIYEAQEVSLEERIEVLEELKRRDYREKWAYELAYLYHSVGMVSRCVEECDELSVWFGKGRYVTKALELKRLHTPLTADQAEKLEKSGPKAESTEEYDRYPEEFVKSADGEEASEMSPEDYGEVLTEEGTFSEGMFMEGISSMEKARFADEEQAGTYAVEDGSFGDRETAMEAAEEAEEMEGYPEQYPEGYPEEAETTHLVEDYKEGKLLKDSDTREYPHVGRYTVPPREQEDMDIRIKPVDVSQYNTINLQQELAESMKEFLSGQQEEPDTVVMPISDIAHEMQQIVQREETRSQEDTPPTEVYFGDTVDTLGAVGVTGQILMKSVERKAAEPYKPAISNTGIIKTFAKSSDYDEILTQEYDGQIGLVLPEEKRIEKQITGQLKIGDILAEWERQKKEIEQKRMEEVRNRVRKQTDLLFADFDESTKSGLLEKLEKAMVDAVMKEERAIKTGPGVIKVADIGANTNSSSKIPAAVLAEWDGEPLDGEDIVEEDIVKEDMTEEEEFETLAYMSVEEEAATLTEAAAEEDTGVPAEAVVKEGTEAPAAVVAKEEAIQNETSSQSAAAMQEETAAQKDTVIQEESSAQKDTVIQEESTAQKDTVIQDESTAQKDTVIQEETTAPEGAVSKEEPVETEPSGETETKVQLPVKGQKAAAQNNTPEAPIRTGMSERDLTAEEKVRFGRIVQNKKTRRQLIHVIDNISMAAYTGNVIITGEEELAAVQVAKGLIKEVQQSDNNFSGKVAKISAETLNKKDVAGTFTKMENGAVIIEKASRMRAEKIRKLLKVLEQESKGYIVILEDIRSAMDKLLERSPELEKIFNLRIDLEGLNDKILVEYAKRYAEDMEYAIDDFGVLALHTRIAEMQTSDHEVTVAEVQEMIDDAIFFADKKNPKHFFDILVGKRYDGEDMIILREKDFMHY